MGYRKMFGLIISGFISAMLMTFFSIWLLKIDAAWHVGQMFQQFAMLSVLGQEVFSEIPTNHWFLYLATAYWDFVENAFRGLAPSTYMLWFVGYLALFQPLFAAINAINNKAHLDKKWFFGLIGFIIFGSVFSTYLAVYIVTIDAAWHLEGIMFHMNILQIIEPDLPIQEYLFFTTLIGWRDFFEHAQGQSSSSYVLWFVIFVLIFIAIAIILGYIVKRMERTDYREYADKLDT